MSQQLLDGFPWDMVHMFVPLPRIKCDNFGYPLTFNVALSSGHYYIIYYIIINILLIN